MPSNPYEPSRNPQATSRDESAANSLHATGQAVTAGKATRHDVEDIQFVHQAIGLASRDPGLSRDGKASAVAVCRVLLEVAVDLYGEGGKELLIQWNLACSEEIGMIVHRLVAAGLESRVSPEPLSAYNGLFDLFQPPETWELKWDDE